MATIYLGNDDADNQASANLLPLVETLQRAGHKVSIRGATPKALARLAEAQKTPSLPLWRRHWRELLAGVGLCVSLAVWLFVGMPS